MGAGAHAPVLIIGKKVDSAIGKVLRRDLGPGVEVVTVYQPNARQFGEADRRACFELCCIRDRTA
jgi:hypothetical protein